VNLQGTNSVYRPGGRGGGEVKKNEACKVVEKSRDNTKK